jgi:hypothetical protein
MKTRNVAVMIVAVVMLGGTVLAISIPRSANRTPDQGKPAANPKAARTQQLLEAMNQAAKEPAKPANGARRVKSTPNQAQQKKDDPKAERARQLMEAMKPKPE